MLISLDDDAVAAVMNAAQPLAPKDRSAFLHDVAAELGKHPGELGAGLIHRVVREVQHRYFNPPSLNGNAGVGRWAR
jgi:hypothetical protein